MINSKDAENITIKELPDETFIHKIKGSNYPLARVTKGIAAFIILLGILSGYLLWSINSKSLNISTNTTLDTNKAQKIVGSADVKTFRDSAEGSLEAGGVNGEGTHRLVRPGGESQTVYLTSSVLDLNQFVGKKVRVWGETNAAQQAGWLMDVGKVEILQE